MNSKKTIKEILEQYNIKKENTLNIDNDITQSVNSLYNIYSRMETYKYDFTNDFNLLINPSTRDLDSILNTNIQKNLIDVRKSFKELSEKMTQIKDEITKLNSQILSAIKPYSHLVPDNSFVFKGSIPNDNLNSTLEQ